MNEHKVSDPLNSVRNKSVSAQNKVTHLNKLRETTCALIKYKIIVIVKTVNMHDKNMLDHCFQSCYCLIRIYSNQVIIRLIKYLHINSH